MMKKCKSCQSEIDSKAKKCPKCQADQRGWFRRHPILTGILILVIVGIIGSAGGSKSSETSNTTSQTAQQQEEKQEPTVVEATALIGEFDKNKLSANEKYKDKVVQTTGYIKNISNDVTGQYFLSLNPNNDQYYFGTTIACYFTEKDELTSLANGQSITVQGTMQEMTLGIVAMKDCKVIK